jgi:hypothetical protein
MVSICGSTCWSAAQSHECMRVHCRMDRWCRRARAPLPTIAHATQTKAGKPSMNHGQYFPASHRCAFGCAMTMAKAASGSIKAKNSQDWMMMLLHLQWHATCSGIFGTGTISKETGYMVYVSISGCKLVDEHGWRDGRVGS